MKSKKGITLITLVITIVILLILAGITITSMTGENGLFTRAKQSKQEAIKASAEEDVRLRIMEASVISDGSVTKESFLEALNNASDTYLIELASVAIISEEGIHDVAGLTGDINVTNVTKYPGVKVKVLSNFTVESSLLNTSSGGSESGSGTGGGSQVGTSNIIGDFTPEIIETNGKYILIRANAANTENIKGYVYFLDNKAVSASSKDSYLYDSLSFNTDYKVSVAAIDINGNIKKSNELPIKTLNYVLNRYVLVEVENPDGCGTINELEVYDSNNQKCSYSIAHIYDSRTGGTIAYENDSRKIWCLSNLKDGQTSYSGANTTSFLYNHNGTMGGFARFIIDLGSATQISEIKMSIGGGTHAAREISTYILPDRFYDELGNKSSYYLNVYYRSNDNLILTHAEDFPDGQDTSEWYDFL